MFYITKENAENELRWTLLKCVCAEYNIPCHVVRLPDEAIPKDLPNSMREFYSHFAPVDINIKTLKIRFFLYKAVFDFLKESSDIIPIALYEGQQMIYMDRHPDGSWDERIQLEIGDGKAEIVGKDIFDYLCNLARRIEDEIH